MTNNPYVDMIDGRPIEPAYSQWNKENSAELEAASIEYKQEATNLLKSSIDNYLEFSTPQELLTVVTDSL